MEPITVVTASVNRKGLRKAVESVQAQTLKPERHIVLVQGTRLESELQVGLPSSVPIEVHLLPPGADENMLQAYTLVESLARTPWMAMLDDDCWWEPNHLATLAELMDEIGADFVWGSSIGHDEETGARLWMRDDPQPKFQHIDTNEILFRRDCIDRWGPHLLEDCDPTLLPKIRNIDGRRIERWVRGGAIYAHSSALTVHYGVRAVPVF